MSRDGGGRWQTGQSGNKAGKPKGTLSRKTLAIQELVAKLGISPAEVLLTLMADEVGVYRSKAVKVTEEMKASARIRAAELAAMVAPYVHAKLAATVVKVEEKPSIIDGKPMTDDEWAVMAAAQSQEVVH